MLSIRKNTQNSKQGNLLSASLCREEDPSRSRLLSLESRLIKTNSIWELYNSSQPSLADEDVAARLTLDECQYVSTESIGYGETFIASKIREMMNTPVSCLRLRTNSLSESQANAATKVLSSKVSILTGGPGTGKTYTLKSIADSLEYAGLSVRWCAPTGTAAKRMSTATGRFASTVHRLLGYKPKTGFGKNEENPLDCDCVVMDEGTMADNPLTYALLKALGDARLILVGDRNQLPPVCSGSPFHSLCNVVPTAELTEVRRTDPDGPIGTACKDILLGKLPEQAKKGESGFFLIPRPAHTLTDYLLHCAMRMNSEVHNVGILSPFNYSCEKLNFHFLEHSRMDSIGAYPIMCVKNDYEEEIFNGEVGLSDRFPCHYYQFEGRSIQFQPWRDRLAFARTIHKSQGGEWNDTLIHNPKNNFVTRNLSYTAVSRGKRRVAVVGCIDSFAKSLTDDRCDKRVTMLGELVTGRARIVQ